MATIARTATYKDLDFTFKQNPNTNDVGIKKDNASIKQSVLNILQKIPIFVTKPECF